MKLINSSYKDGVIMLLKDLSEEITEITVDEKEELIRSGISYSEFISKENIPSNEITKIFFNQLEKTKHIIANYISKVSKCIINTKGDKVALVSLARAGTPFGILIKKYIKYKYNVDVVHYSISIIRGKGIDFNALKYIADKSGDLNIQFIDGWTGKGSITKELLKSIREFNNKFNLDVSSELAVIADPARLCTICGTREDVIIPNCVLNSTVSGLVSRTILNEKYIGKDDFHGAKYLSYLLEYDYSEHFIKVIEENFRKDIAECEIYEKENIADEIAREVQVEFKVKDINKIKLSIGESSRALLRRKVSHLLVKDLDDENIKHIMQLAKEKDVKVIKYDKSHYKCIAIIEA
ncbi:MAG: tellurite-like stress resistance cysteine protease StiP [Clostridium sp.]|uniref:cysteine protease StiP domain-containing protein n=1 Tax=Clostridium sp. TaxID=1506 RepID=UPI002FC8A790